MTAPRPPAPRRAFTLIELAVVLAALAVLAVLIVPACLHAVGEARSLQCQARLRQIGSAYSRYTSDSGGLWPPILTTADPPLALQRRIAAETGLEPALPRPAQRWGQPGPHWSLVLWPYLGDLAAYTCPADPKAGLRGAEVLAPGRENSVAFHDAPPESYALNVLLFRTGADLRRMAGCTWNAAAAGFDGLQQYTTLGEQRRQFPALGERVLFFCGASGQTFGSQFNVAFRTGGLVERWEWHPRPAPLPFVDAVGCGSNYLFADGHVEYRDLLPDPWEWGCELVRAPAAP